MSCCQFRIESELGEVYWTIQQTTITYYRKIHFYLLYFHSHHLEQWCGYQLLTLKQNIMKLDLNAMEQARLDMAQEGIIMTPLTQEDKQLLQSILN